MINGNHQRLAVAGGNLQAVGTSISRITFNDVRIGPAPADPAFPGLLQIEYAEISGGSIWEATGNAVYAGFTLRQSQISGLTTGMYFWYPVSNVVIENCTFVGSGSATFLLNNGILSSVSRNLFNLLSGGSFVITNQAAYGGSDSVLQFNTFAGNVNLVLPPGDTSAKMTATGNYWGTTDTAIIDGRITDKNDEPNSAGFISYLPILTVPDPATPILAVNLAVTTTGSGSVVAAPSGIDCGAICSAGYAFGTPVELTAAAADGYRFEGWSGACSGGTIGCTLVMDGGKSVFATFAEGLAKRRRAAWKHALQ